MLTQTIGTIINETIPARHTIPPAIHLAGILLLIAVTAVCGPLSAVLP
ncbi:hypothetical protein [Methanoregula boonei]|jgi:hypothetical protein|nr:hypothetical protein [Methanoregula boonei]